MKTRKSFIKITALSIAVSFMLSACGTQTATQKDQVISTKTFATKRLRDSVINRPYNLSFTDLSENNVTILWDHNDTSSDGFIVYYAKLPFDAIEIGDVNFTNAAIINDKSIHQVTLSNLESNSTYGVKVSSCMKYYIDGAVDKVDSLCSKEEVVITTLPTIDTSNNELEKPKFDAWCVTHWSNIIEITEIPVGIDGVNIYRRDRDGNGSGELILTETEIGEYLDPNDNLQPSYEAYEYIAKSFKDDNGTITESSGVIVQPD